MAALIARRPTCVLLDEPTNHLDDSAVEFLESFLVDLPGVVVVASHDRAFLDNVCTQIVDLDPSHFGTDGDGGNRFSGGYSAYLTAKQQARARWEQAFLDQQDELNELREAAATTARRVAHNRPPRDNDKFIYFGKGQKVARTISRRVRDAEKRIEVLESERIPKPPKPLAFRGSLAPEVMPGRAVQVRDLVVQGRVSVPFLDVAGGDHLLITGANGSGKSTLLKVLAGQLQPSSGVAAVNARRTGFLPQDVTFRHPERTAAPGVRRPHGLPCGSRQTSACSTPGTCPVRSAHSATANSVASRWPCLWHGDLTCSSSTSPPTTSLWHWPRSSRSHCSVRPAPW